MALEYAFTFPLKNGLHARPASVLQEAAGRFRSEATLANAASGRQARVASVLSLVGSATRQGDRCVLRLEGPDEAEAMAALRVFLEKEFPRCDDDLPAPAPAAAGAAAPPRIVRRSGAAFLAGTRASGGVGVGSCVIVRGLALPETLPGPAGTLEEEWVRFTAAIAPLEAELHAGIAAASSSTERGILKAHLSLLGDPDLAAQVRRALEARRGSIGEALIAATEAIGAAMSETGSAYLAARALDIQDLASRLIGRIYDLPEMKQAIVLGEPAIVAAQELAPSQLLALDRAQLRGLVLGQTGATSHTVILARALGVPCITGIGEGMGALRHGQRVIIDGQRGVVIGDPTAEVDAYYELETARLETIRRAQEATLARPATTADGHRLEVGANVSSAEEAEAAFVHGAEGIGVFRTEMLFMDRPEPPTEEQQAEIYGRVARAAGSRPALIRLLDIGGDKPLPYLNLPKEANPFLGWRGVRFYPAFTALLTAQIRAILRGAADGNLKIMIPMVDTLDEIRWVRQTAAAAAEALTAEGVAHRWPVEIGIMVETPVAAFSLGRLAAESDFFSIGTNDLTQYFYAADRGNNHVAGLLNVRAPEFIDILRHACAQARAAGKWIGLCGEMGGHVRNLPLLVGVGLNEISMAPPAIPAVKAALGRWTHADCVQAVQDALQAAGAAQVESILDAMPDPASALPLIDEGVIVLDSEAGCKELAIKELIDRLAITGRAEDPEAVEEAIWSREDVYATSVGFGFAIPHCKSAALRANTIALLRLRHGIEWKHAAPDHAHDEDSKARLIIMLAIREADHSDTHLRLFAQLARKVMHESFREGLLHAATPAAALALIGEVLGM